MNMNTNTSTDTNTNSKWKWADGNTRTTKESNRINQSSQSSNQRGNDHSIPSHLFLHSATLIIETESNDKPSQDKTIAKDTRFLTVTSNSSQQNLCTKFQFSASHRISLHRINTNLKFNFNFDYNFNFNCNHVLSRYRQKIKTTTFFHLYINIIIIVIPLWESVTIIHITHVQI